MHDDGVRVDIRVSFGQNSHEFLANRVSYFAKICSLFREILCYAKQTLACESQFWMFRISRDKTLNKRNKTELQRRMKKPCSFHIKISFHILISTIFPFTAPYKCTNIQRDYCIRRKNRARRKKRFTRFLRIVTTFFLDNVLLRFQKWCT